MKKSCLIAVLCVLFFSLNSQARSRATCGRKMRAAANVYCTSYYTGRMFAKLGSISGVKAHVRGKMRRVCWAHCRGIVSCNRNYNSCSALRAALSRINYDSETSEDGLNEDLNYQFLSEIEEQVIDI